MKKAIRKVAYDFSLGSVSCLHYNCHNKTFYVVRQRDFFNSMAHKKTVIPFRIILICTKCGEPEVYGD